MPRSLVEFRHLVLVSKIEPPTLTPVFFLDRPSDRRAPADCQRNFPTPVGGLMSKCRLLLRKSKARKFPIRGFQALDVKFENMQLTFLRSPITDDAAFLFQWTSVNLWELDRAWTGAGAPGILEALRDLCQSYGGSAPLRNQSYPQLVYPLAWLLLMQDWLDIMKPRRASSTNGNAGWWARLLAGFPLGILGGKKSHFGGFIASFPTPV